MKVLMEQKGGGMHPGTKLLRVPTGIESGLDTRSREKEGGGGEQRRKVKSAVNN